MAQKRLNLPEDNIPVPLVQFLRGFQIRLFQSGYFARYAQSCNNRRRNQIHAVPLTQPFFILVYFIIQLFQVDVNLLLPTRSEVFNFFLGQL